VGVFTLPILGDAGGPQFTNYGDTGFGSMGGVPNLGVPTLPSVTPVPSTGGFSSGVLTGLTNPIQAASELSNASGSDILGAAGSIASYEPTIFGHRIGFSIEDSIFIILGLLLITAGIFSFRTSQTIITTAGRGVARVASTAAAAA
jgi:hypothetical protein